MVQRDGPAEERENSMVTVNGSALPASLRTATDPPPRDDGGDAAHRARSNVAIIHCVIGLCQRLDIEITAEGIETPEEATVLETLGCQFGQGYLLGRPMTSEEAMTLAWRLNPLG